MPYSYAVLYLTYSLFIAGIQSLVTSIKGRKTGSIFMLGPFLILLSTAVLSPIVVEFFNNFQLQTGQAVSIDQDNRWQLSVSAVACAMSIGYYAFRLRHIARVGEPRFVSIGNCILGLICSAFVIFTVSDHFIFFKNRENAGTLSVDLMANVTDRSGNKLDIDCPGRTVIVADIKETPTRWRCPKLLVLGGQVSPTPFIPWPSYVEGKSANLSQIVQDMTALAIHAEDDAKRANNK